MRRYTKGTTDIFPQKVVRQGTLVVVLVGIDAGSTALELAHAFAAEAPYCAESAEVLAVMRQRCCSTCGMTSSGLPAMPVGRCILNR